MTAKQVLSLASVFLNLSEEFKPLIDEDTTVIVDTRTQFEFNNLLHSLNLCYQEIALDYLPIYYTQSVVVENNKIYYTDLTKDVKDIYSIVGVDKTKSFKFTQFPEYVHVQALGLVNITYSYIPNQLTLDSSIQTFGGRISLKCLALGTASEYCFISGLYEDAEIWDDRYKNLLKLETRKKGEIRLPKRRWL